MNKNKNNQKANIDKKGKQKKLAVVSHIKN